jgi:beta-glucosidase
VREDGRGPSIWDTFSHTPGRIRDGSTGDVACDQYHRFEADLDLVSALGLGAYRFSIAWPRIQPAGRGTPDPRGLDHYRRVVDACLERGIVPVVTLYHWDLPQALEDAGGWPARDTAERFADYAGSVGDALGDTVPMWLTINEPMVSAWLGYATGDHAPGLRDESLAAKAVHHLLLAHGLAAAALRSRTDGDVGLSLNLYPCRPATDSPADAAAATEADDQLNRLYLDPVFGRPYPASVLERYAAAFDGLMHDGDLPTIAAPIDFLGVNYYTVHTITADPDVARRGSELPPSFAAWSTTPPDVEVTSLGWPIQPDGLAEMLRRVHRDYGPARLYVTENGAAFADPAPEGGLVGDPRRVAYLAGHAGAVLEAIGDGVPLAGYLVWSLLDNFEWAEGYGERFGVMHVDFETQERTPKASARWLSELARTGRIPAPRP